VVAYSKSSESDPRNYWSTLAEPFTQRPVGLDEESAAGLYAHRYLNKYALKASDLTVISDRAWSAAAGNDMVETDDHTGADPTWDDIVAAPLRRRDMARTVDGAVAMVIATRHVAHQVTASPVWITGMGSAVDQHFLAAREPTSLPAAEAAAKSALRMAGIDSARDLDVIEISTTSSVGELMVLEALGMADPGKAIELYKDDRLPALNPSGGALAANVVMATGLVRLHEVASQLSGRSDHAPKHAQRGLAHGTGGLGMQNHCVVTLEAS
jgi:acetyl-CoA C-acetyltransferase